MIMNVVIDILCDVDKQCSSFYYINDSFVILTYRIRLIPETLLRVFLFALINGFVWEKANSSRFVFLVLSVTILQRVTAALYNTSQI